MPPGRLSRSRKTTLERKIVSPKDEIITVLILNPVWSCVDLLNLLKKTKSIKLLTAGTFCWNN